MANKLSVIVRPTTVVPPMDAPDKQAAYAITIDYAIPHYRSKTRAQKVAQEIKKAILRAVREN